MITLQFKLIELNTLLKNACDTHTPPIDWRNIYANNLLLLTKLNLVKSLVVYTKVKQLNNNKVVAAKLLNLTNTRTCQHYTKAVNFFTLYDPMFIPSYPNTEDFTVVSVLIKLDVIIHSVYINSYRDKYTIDDFTFMDEYKVVNRELFLINNYLQDLVHYQNKETSTAYDNIYRDSSLISKGRKLLNSHVYTQRTKVFTNKINLMHLSR